MVGSVWRLMLLLPLVGASFALQAADMPSKGSNMVRYFDGPWPSQRLDVLDAANRDALTRASELVDYNKSDFANVYVDDLGTVVVTPATVAGAIKAVSKLAADDAAVQVSPVSDVLSIHMAGEMGNNLYDTSARLAEKMSSWKGDPRSTRLLVSVWQPLGQSDEETIEAFAEKHSVAIDVYYDSGDKPAEKSESRLEDDSPVAGGFRYVMKNGNSSSATGSGWCSGGFGYHIGSVEYMLTAGHCFSQGTSFRYMWNTYDGSCCTKKTYLGQEAGSVWENGVGSKRAADGEYHGDVALVLISNAGDQVWWGAVGTTDKIPVTVRRVPTIGDPMCINGAKSGSDCGLVVQDVNINHTYSDGDVLRNGDKAHSSSEADCSRAGDSGGSIVYDHSGAETQATGIGIVSGSTIRATDCDEWFTGIEEANQIWGGNINFN